MFLRLRFGWCCCRWWNGERFALQSLRRSAGAGPAGDGPLAKPLHRTERDGNAMLFEPLGDGGIRPMFATQGEDGFAMQLQFAARSALGFVFG